MSAPQISEEDADGGTADPAPVDPAPIDGAPVDGAESAAAGAPGPRWCRATRLVVAAAAAWLVFVLLHLALGQVVWWLPAEAVPPIGFVAAPALLLAAIPAPRLTGRRMPAGARRIVAATTLTALALGAGSAGLNLHALTAAPPPRPGGISVFSWNTQYWDQADDPGRFHQFISAQHADVYLLQEHFTWDFAAGDSGARQVDDQAQLRREFPGYFIAARGELLTLSRFPIVATPPVGPPVPAGAAFGTVESTAKVLRTDLRVGDRVLSVYNVHIPVQFTLQLSRFVGQLATAEAARREQLRALQADVAANPQPVLLAGDFNTSPAMSDLRGIRGRLVDAVRASRSIYPASWNATSWLRLWRLDWAFTTPDVRVERYELVDPAGMSDHRAQRLRLDLST